MQRCRYVFIASIALGWLCTGALAADESAGDSDRSSVSDHLRAAGADVARESKKFGAAVKEGAERVGTAAKKVSHQVADASVKGAHEVRDAAKGVAAKTKNAVKRESSSRDEKPAT